jgi:hypothetical protein
MMLLNICRVVEIETNMKMESGPAPISEGEWWEGTTQRVTTVPVHSVTDDDAPLLDFEFWLSDTH